MSPRTILIAVDESDHSQHAFRWLVKELFRPDDNVVAFHVAESPNLPSLSISSPLSVPVEEWHRILVSRLEVMRALEEEYLGTARDCGVRSFHFVAANADGCNPGEAVVEAAVKYGASHIVLGCRGLGSLRRAFLGSVSDYVVRNSRVPTSVVPGVGDRAD